MARWSSHAPLSRGDAPRRAEGGRTRSSEDWSRSSTPSTHIPSHGSSNNLAALAASPVLPCPTEVPHTREGVPTPAPLKLPPALYPAFRKTPAPEPAPEEEEEILEDDEEEPEQSDATGPSELPPADPHVALPASAIAREPRQRLTVLPGSAPALPMSARAGESNPDPSFICMHLT